MRVSLITPCRNEAPYIEGFLDSALSQALPAGWAMELIVADGTSDDGTRERLQARAAADARLQVVDNPAGHTAGGLNRALRAATGDVVVRLDVHTTYAEDYVQRCVEALDASGATCVGGPWRPWVGEGRATAIALAWASPFGSGGAPSRRVEHRGPVDTVYLGAWRRAELLRLGGFDEALLRTEDDDLSLRIVRGGGVVWQEPAIRSWYRPRGTFTALAAQMYQYGYWKVPLIRKHRLPASPRHLVPGLFVLGLVALALGGLWDTRLAVAAVALLALHAGVALAAAGTLVRPWQSPARWVGIAWATVCMHGAYGAGFLHGVIDAVVRRGRAGRAATRLTR